MTTPPTQPSKPLTPNYGVDAPAALRNLFFFGTLCLLLGIFLPQHLVIRGDDYTLHKMFRIMAFFLLLEASLFLFYVKVGKLWHRDMMLSLIPWRGDEQVLDVGCGRGLLLIGAAKKLTTGHATGIDLWSNVDMGGNSTEATMRNINLEEVESRTTLLSLAAQNMTFPDGHFDVIVSNLCIHNIYDKPTRQAALAQIVRVLAPGGTALISDFKHTGQYKKFFAEAGLVVTNRRGSFLSTFPPLNVIIARKPLQVEP